MLNDYQYNSITRDQIVNEARKYLFVPYIHQGRVGLHGIKGVDCAGLICGVLDTLKVPYKDAYGYSRQADGVTLEDLFSYALIRKSNTIECILPSDIVMFWISNKTKRPQHVGIVTKVPSIHNSFSFIHAWASVKKVVEHPFTKPWIKRIHSIWQIPGIVEGD